MIFVLLFSLVLFVICTYTSMKAQFLEGEVKGLKSKLDSVPEDDLTMRIYGNNGKSTDLGATEIEIDKGYFYFSDQDSCLMMVVREQDVNCVVRLRNGEEDIIQTEDRKVISFNDN